jgi:hypothetical protein
LLDCLTTPSARLDDLAATLDASAVVLDAKAVVVDFHPPDDTLALVLATRDDDA